MAKDLRVYSETSVVIATCGQCTEMVRVPAGKKLVRIYRFHYPNQSGWCAPKCRDAPRRPRMGALATAELRRFFARAEFMRQA